jgi:hypothetical protein
MLVSTRSRINIETTADICFLPSEYGLPTACWGYQFDSTLDNKLGLYDLSHFDYADVVSAITLQDNEVISGNGTLSKRFVGPLAKKLVDVAKQGAHATMQAVGGAAKRVADETQNAANRAKQALNNSINSLKGQLRVTYDHFQAAVKDIQDGAQTLVEFLNGRPIEIPFDESPKDCESFHLRYNKQTADLLSSDTPSSKGRM